jgi:iron complex outermembrane receptor protein
MLIKLDVGACIAGVLLAVLGPIAHAQEVKMPEVLVKASRIKGGSPTTAALGEAELSGLRSQSSDSTRLLQDVPGVSMYGAGGISSLPAIRGLADDRLRIQVNGADLMAACPNHMNSALSYIAPADVASVKVYEGVTPVSVGGDSLGGTIQVNSAPPVFADEGQAPVIKGQAGVFVRSNGRARGGNLSASMGAQNLSLSYSANTAQAGNYRAAQGFKPVSAGTEGGPLLAAEVVGSSAYHFVNQEVGLAWRRDMHQWQLNLSQQRVFFEGFPNQRMDMTGNDNELLNLRYKGQFDAGDVEARLYRQETRHQMDMGPDRYFYGMGMPMDTKASTYGGALNGTWSASPRDTLRAGAEYQLYTLYDWWPPVGGSMGPHAFWNIDYGRRHKAEAFVEWDARWSKQWFSQLGLRHSVVKADAAAVQGYNDNLAALWGNEAAAFNARGHEHTDQNWDWMALIRTTPGAGQTLEFGYAHKTRSPSLYQRYPWSTQPMAALMNNFVGDGNGYVGNEDLKPEIADTLSASGEWRSAEANRWSFKVATYLTEVQDYVDAQRCNTGQCSQANQTTTSGFVLLQYVNQSARLYGLDVSGQVMLSRTPEWGSVSASGVFSAVRGDNTRTGEPLYNIMPPNLKVALVQRQGGWTNTAELQWVAAKTRVSGVRNEVPTSAYSLLNLRSSYAWRQMQLDVGVENALDRFYELPLGGAYVGQGASMTTNGIPWGVPVPGMGRSVNVAMSVRY